MQNYMRTILSGLQNWINKRLHETVPETDKAHMQLIKDENGATSWEERTHYKEVTTREVVNAVNVAASFYEDDNGDGVNDAACFLTPWSADIVAGNTYVVTWNGVEYACPAVALEEIEGSMPVEGVTVIGNLTSTGIEGLTGNPDAPFVMMSIPNASAAVFDGMYGFAFYFDSAETVTISIRGVVTTTTYKELEEGYLPESVRNGAVKQIIITINDDGTVTSDTDFETAWAMTPAQLQAAIAINKANTYMYNSLSQSPILVSKFENTNADGFKEIQIQHQEYIYDTSDVLGSSQKIINWHPDGLYVDQFNIPGMHTSQFFSADRKYPVLSGDCFSGVTAEDLKDDLDIVDPVFVVTVDNVVNNVGTADKTFAEIKAAHDAGQVVLCEYGGQYHRLIQCYSDSASFMVTLYAASVILGREIKITESDATVREHWIELGSYVNDAIEAVLPTPTTADAGKILRVNSDGKYELVSLPNAEEATF